MSGPVTTDDAAPAPGDDAPVACELEVIEGRATSVGGFGVRRVLPRRPRRTVGPWCFVDHMGPGSVSDDGGLDIGPHPHIGLQTVTWLLEGAVLHRDSLGSEQVIRPGQLNLMTAGWGVSHAEETTGTYAGTLHGVQLWVAQPASTRDGAPAFEHHPELPAVELDGVGVGVATVLIGSLAGTSSPARRDTDHVGIDLDLRPGRAVVPLDRRFEHALVVLDGAVSVGGRTLEPGRLGYLGLDRDELALDVGAGGARVLLIGGVPFPEPLLLWWNYVARTRDEITAAHRAWTSRDERFGAVASPVPAIDTAGPPWGES
jgi:redox-sensitive bicupin YhaK (pirin superfamily)